MNLTAARPAVRTPEFDYASILSASEKVDWRVEDLIRETSRLDFTKRFLPDSLARVDALAFLTREQRRTLDHIRGHFYLYMFGLVEEFILPFVLGHVDPAREDGEIRDRALLGFASEEAKHIDLFARFGKLFRRTFGHELAVIGPPEQIGAAVLAHRRLAVGLLILHIEWMTQAHYVDAVKTAHELDPLFESLLRHHWMEEAQHARIDTLLVEEMAASMSQEEIEASFEDLLKIAAMIDGGLAQQVELDLEALERITGLELTSDEREQARKQQLQALRWTFLGSGLVHPRFLATLERLSPALRRRIEELTPAFC
jgi:hypothetical protein